MNERRLLHLLLESLWHIPHLEILREQLVTSEAYSFSRHIEYRKIDGEYYIFLLLDD